MAEISEREIAPKLREETREMCREVLEMLHLAWEAFRRQDCAPLNRAGVLGRDVHRTEKTMTERIPRDFAGQHGVSVQAEFSFLPMHLERVGDNIEFLVRAIRTCIEDGVPFSERAVNEINALFGKAIELVECMRDAIDTRNKVLVRHIMDEGRRYESMIGDFALSHQERLIEGLCAPKASSMYLAILDYLKGIQSHICQMAGKLG